MADAMDYATDEATHRRIMEARVEALRRVSDFVLKTQEDSYNDACEKTDDDEPYGHIYIYALCLNAWLEELEKETGFGIETRMDRKNEDPLVWLCGDEAPTKRSFVQNLFLGAAVGVGIAVGIALIDFLWKMF